MIQKKQTLFILGWNVFVLQSLLICLVFFAFFPHQLHFTRFDGIFRERLNFFHFHSFPIEEKSKTVWVVLFEIFVSQMKTCRKNEQNPSIVAEISWFENLDSTRPCDSSHPGLRYPRKREIELESIQSVFLFCSFLKQSIYPCSRVSRPSFQGQKQMNFFKEKKQKKAIKDQRKIPLNRWNPFSATQGEKSAYIDY